MFYLLLLVGNKTFKLLFHTTQYPKLVTCANVKRYSDT